MSAYGESSHPTQASSTAGTTTSSTKRRRVEGDYGYIAPSTSRTAAKAAAAQQAAQASTSTSSSSRGHAHANTSSQNMAVSGTFVNQTPREQEMMTAVKARFAAPTLSLATLPPPALQRYLSRYGLLESHGSLSYHHAVFPVPPLPVTLPSPLTGRQLTSRRLYRPTTNATTSSSSSGGANALTTAMDEDQDGTTMSNPVKRPRWQEPKTTEFKSLSAYDDPVVVTNRLAAKAKEHWDKRESVKEGETLTNFMFALRMRGKARLRLIPFVQLHRVDQDYPKPTGGWSI